MACTFEIVPDERLIRCRLSGVLSVDECLGLLERVRADPRYDPAFDCLADNRELVGGFRREELEQVLPVVARIFAGIRARPRTAIVVGSDLQFGVTRVFQTLADGVENLNLRIFRDLEEAEMWVKGE